METTTVQQREKVRFNNTELKWVEKVARLMDSKFTLPGTKFRFGLDPIFSLIPVLGDLVTYIISGVLIYTMYQHGASRKLVIKMTANATLDAILGAIPIVGTIFDFFYKANERNVRLLREHYEEGKHTGKGTGLLIGIVAGLVLLVIVVFILLWKVIEAIFQLF